MCLCHLETGAASVPVHPAASVDEAETQVVEASVLDAAATSWKDVDTFLEEQGSEPPDFVPCLE